MHANDEAWDDLNWRHPVDCTGCEDCDNDLDQPDEEDIACAA